MDFVYLQHDQSFCTGQTVSSPPLQVLPFVLGPCFKAAGVSLQIHSGGGKKLPILSHVALENINMRQGLLSCNLHGEKHVSTYCTLCDADSNFCTLQLSFIYYYKSRNFGDPGFVEVFGANVSFSLALNPNVQLLILCCHHAADF